MEGPLQNPFLLFFTSFIFIGAYLIGSIPFGFLIAKLWKIDIRLHGSKNIGATNVWRVMGKKWGILVFILDFLKGYLPILLLLTFWNREAEINDHTLAVIAAIALILGHNHPIWLDFKGGKGIATSAGILVALMPWSFLAAFSCWLIGFAITRIVSVGSILACIALPLSTFFTYRNEPILLFFSLVAGSLGLLRHKSNISRLWAGEEKPLTSGPEKPS
ncbi:MAG: glycerol-3-phosphate 1-O-acyltransferase PlsY [Methylacidiphilales bacterium]|nr:glycerol-3-phosphate 1-O-acyltransferase PlsY [Candidatus Methylacidiphilales bacterium]MDW8350015.1 glycerol-3-phosphate 1-O-acyltransferase PlsY [Verrucomicrobiae bacterium]